MKCTSSLILLGAAASTLALAAPQQSSPLPSSIPMFAAPTGMTVNTITFTEAFGTVPAGYVTLLTQPIQPSGPVYLTTTDSASATPTDAPASSTEHHSSTTRHSSSPSRTPTTPTTPVAASSTQAAPQQTTTNAAVALGAGAAGVPAALAVMAGWALF